MFNDTDEGKTHYYGDDCQPPHTQQNPTLEGWEERLERLMSEWKEEDGDWPDIEVIGDFISTEIIAAKEEGRKEERKRILDKIEQYQTNQLN